MSRKKAAQKKSPTPLTADMLNELNKNHMGGIENYGADELYNVDDNWGDDYNDYKPKVSSVSPKAASLQLSGPKQNKNFMYLSLAAFR